MPIKMEVGYVAYGGLCVLKIPSNGPQPSVIIIIIFNIILVNQKKSLIATCLNAFCIRFHSLRSQPCKRHVYALFFVCMKTCAILEDKCK